jgi:hypothetical protein
MKRGIILYVTGDPKDFSSCERIDLERLGRRLGVQSVRVATSEDDITDGWWRMIAQGMQEVCCMRARFNPGEGQLEPEGSSFRLCG